MEQGGADFDKEIAKLNRLGAQVRETHLDRAGGARTTLLCRPRVDLHVPRFDDHCLRSCIGS